ncbi:MAG: anaerobic ribonucleoside-triphosphate reductase, partial [Puniceicoccales bacterium]
DRAQFPEAVVANPQEVERGAQPYYSNSTQLPVNYTDDPFEVLDLQEETQSKYTGGTVIHLFLGERVSDLRTVRDFVRRVAENYTIPYFSLTPTFSVCPVHGYLSGEHHNCPHCGEQTEIYSRIVGYLRPVSQWNDGKQSEFTRRKMLRIDTNGSKRPRPERTEQVFLPVE